MTDSNEAYFKVVYNKNGEVLDVEPLQGGQVVYKKIPMKDNPISDISSVVDTHIIISKARETCQWVHQGCQLWYICW